MVIGLLKCNKNRGVITKPRLDVLYALLTFLFKWRLNGGAREMFVSLPILHFSHSYPERELAKQL